MKKMFKITVLFCLMVMVVLTMASCDQLLDKIFVMQESGQSTTNPNNEKTTTPQKEPEQTTPPEVHTHAFGDWTMIKKATCTEGGQRERSCSCGEKETKKINALGHNEVVDVAVANSCTTDGLTAGSHCADCGKILVKQEIVKAFGHTEVIDEAIEATCTVEGKTEGKHCSVCNQVLVEQVAVKVEHAYTSTMVEPTATTEGYTKYTCSNCNHTYTEDIKIIEGQINRFNRHLLGYTGVENEELIISAVFQENGEWFRITHIDDAAFRDCDNLRAVVIPASIRSIGSEAFSNCTNLRSVDIPNGVTSIGEFAFGLCNNLMSITIPESVTSIGSLAFFSCFKLVEVYNLSSLTIEKGADTNGGVGLYALDVYTSKSEISKLWEDDNGYIFYENGDVCYLIGYMGNAVELTLPDNCNGKKYAINHYAFYDYESLTSVTIPKGVTSIGNYAFFECDKITNLTIADGVTIIGDYAFYWCYGITNLRLPNSVIRIGKEAFKSCINLTSIVMPKNLTSIGDSAFSGCRSLLSVTVPQGVTSIGDSAFSGCYSLIEVYNLSSLNITKKSRKNGEIGYYAIDIHTTQEAESKLWNNGDGYIFYEGYEICYLMRYFGDETELTLPDSCNGKSYAIYYRAFFGCHNLTSIKFSSGVARIESEAFRACDGLVSITLADSITSIEGSAFYQSSLKDVTFNGTVEQWYAIILDTYWNNWAPITKIVCCNGEVEIKYVHQQI